MNIHVLRDPPPEALGRALADFESQFTYPLGPSRTFRIEHGDDYGRFYRSIGPGAVLVAEANSTVRGTLSVATRPLLFPDGVERMATYIGDLKISPSAGGRTLVRLANAARGNFSLPPLGAHSENVGPALAIVMDGTRRAPTNYTGRLGIPAFSAVGKVVILRVPTSIRDASLPPIRIVPSVGRELYRRLSRGRFACPAGDSSLRSESEPLWITDAAGTSCGLLEDTRRAKRLWVDDGAELVSGHLSCFAFSAIPAGQALLASAASLAGKLGVPALFTAVAEADGGAFADLCERSGGLVAPASVYGAGLPDGLAWNVNTAEI